MALALNALTTTVSTGSKTGGGRVHRARGRQGVSAAGRERQQRDPGRRWIGRRCREIQRERRVRHGHLQRCHGRVRSDHGQLLHTGAATHFALHTDSLPEIWVRLNGVNVKKNAKCVLELYRVAMDPADTLEWINSKRSNMSLPGAVLADLTKDKDGAMGQFGRYIEIG